MSRRRRKRRAAAAARVVAAPASPPAAAEAPGERRWRIGYVVARNAVPVVGVFVLGWSATALLLLYFADTMAGMWAVLAALTYRFSGADATGRLGDALNGILGAFASALFLAAMIAVPLGIPLLFVLGLSEPWWAIAWADPEFRIGVAILLLTAVVAAVRHYLAVRRGEEGGLEVKRDFAILITRWMLVVLVMYWIAGLAGRAAPYLLVVAYAAASAWSDLEPERFANLFPERRGSRPGA